MDGVPTVQGVLDPNEKAFYQHTMDVLREKNVPFLVGGAYALNRYTGIERHTKDFDIFIRKVDIHKALNILKEAGYETELTFPHWLGKIHNEDAYVDLIFSSGNGIAVVDDHWFDHATEGVVLDREVLLCPAEEILWSKSFIMERERFDGNDVAHLLHACAKSINWARLLERFSQNWRVLFVHLVLLGYIYPGERDLVPNWVLQELMSRLKAEMQLPPPPIKVCRGTILSREQYLPDIVNWGYEDARLEPMGLMSVEDIRHWTDAIADK